MKREDVEPMTDERPLTDADLDSFEPLFRQGGHGFCYNYIREAGQRCVKEIRRLRAENRTLKELRDGLMSSIECQQGEIERLKKEILVRDAVLRLMTRDLEHQAEVVTAAREFKEWTSALPYGKNETSRKLWQNLDRALAKVEEGK